MSRVRPHEPKPNPTSPSSLSLETNPYHLMSFLHSSKIDENVVYAAGGVPHTGQGTWPREFAYIPLDPKVDLNVQAKLLCQMKSDKIFPLIVEMGGSIFVLSSVPGLHLDESNVLPHVEPITFEVYNPKKPADGWASLSGPLFSEFPYDSPISVDGYSYFVLDGQKLFVSDGMFSCVFDTGSQSWEKCDLFSKCFPNVKFLENWYQPYQLRRLKRPDCGPGFPFRGQAILWKDNIFLCLLLDQFPSIAAFSVSKGQDKAVRVELLYDQPTQQEFRGELRSLVDIGDDRVAVLRYQFEFEIETIMILKLEKVDSGVSCAIKRQHRCRGNPDMTTARYCFAF